MWLRDLVYAGHMLDMARKAVGKTEGLTREGYDADENLRLALTHLVQVIGEAARRVSADFTNGHPEIPWADIIGMRHKVVHDYLGVDEDIVWQVVTEGSSRSFHRVLRRPRTVTTGSAGRPQVPSPKCLHDGGGVAWTHVDGSERSEAR